MRHRSDGDATSQDSFKTRPRVALLLTVSTENGCDYCVAAHTVAARMAKVPDDVIFALRDATPITDPRLAVLHQLTSKIVRHDDLLAQKRPEDHPPPPDLRAGARSLRQLNPR